MNRHYLDSRANYVTKHADEDLTWCLENKDKTNMELLIENVRWRKDMPNRKGRYLKDIAKMFPDCKIAYDVAHGYINREPMSEIVKYKDKIQLFHLSDTKGREDLHLPIGEGEIDWPKFWKVLAKINYKGYLILENE